MKVFTQKGLGLVEVMVALAILGTIGYVFMKNSTKISQSASEQKKLDNLEDVVLRNVFRVRSANIETLPGYGTKVMRVYYGGGTLEKEENPSTCVEGERADRISVCITYSSVKDEEVTFSHPQFLKIPQFGQKLYKVDIEGKMLSSGRTLVRKITVFKR